MAAARAQEDANARVDGPTVPLEVSARRLLEHALGVVVAGPVRPRVLRLAAGYAVGVVRAAPPLVLALVGPAVRAPPPVPVEGVDARAAPLKALPGRRVALV